MTQKIKPLNGLVLVEEIKEQEKTNSGIIIAETKTKHKLQKAKVISVGDGFPLPITLNLSVSGDQKEILSQLVDLVRDGVPPRVKVGDTVVYKVGDGTEIMLEGKDYILISEIHLKAVL
jgi:co-chaperonin GroES (HSP10)